MRNISTISDVVAWRLCIGCGACYALCDKDAVTLKNFESIGIRPVFNEKCIDCDKCLAVCPGYRLDENAEEENPDSLNYSNDIGPYLEIWEGYAADEKIRHLGSSGGVVTALKKV